MHKLQHCLGETGKGEKIKADRVNCPKNFRKRERNFSLSAPHLACVASVSNRVIARKLERSCSCPSFLDEPREETLATQATPHFVL